MPDDRWVREVDVRAPRVRLVGAANLTVARGTDTTSAILQENADFLLTEGGDFILQEVNNG